jgi:two-component sensor histidine kinase
MILSELITNAACHAFDEGPGRIWVEATYHDSEVTCRVEDSGTGREVGPRGRGLEIIDTLVQELHGRMVQHFGANGSVATLVFPTVAKRPLRAAGLGTQTAAYPSKL